MKKQLWFDTWTENYMEGLPIGNGRLAAMMLGKPEKLRIALNHEWLWRGENRFRECKDVAEHCQAIVRGTTMPLKRNNIYKYFPDPMFP